MVRVGPPIVAASRLFQPALVVLPRSRLERAAAAKIGGPTIGLQLRASVRGLSIDDGQILEIEGAAHCAVFQNHFL
jgi:hypothetical protein